MPDLNYLRDPTSEAATTIRPTRPLPGNCKGKTIALLDISKERSSEFLDRMALKLLEAGYPVKRYRKGSHSKTAAPEIIETIVQEADLVIESLAD